MRGTKHGYVSISPLIIYFIFIYNFLVPAEQITIQAQTIRTGCFRITRLLCDDRKRMQIL